MTDLDDRIEAYRSIEQTYRESAVAGFDPEIVEWFLAIRGNGPKKLRKAQRGGIETWRFARGSRKALERAGLNAMFEFQHAFRWRFQRND